RTWRASANNQGGRYTVKRRGRYMVIDRKVLVCAAVGCLVSFAACQPKQTGTNSLASNTQQTKSPSQDRVARPLPDSGFRAEITAPEPPERLRTGQVAIINIKV